MSIRDKVNTKQFNRSIAKQARAMIYDRIKRGYGVSNPIDNDAIQIRLLKLRSKKYKDLRKRIKLGDRGAPGKSNLTLSGQMLNALSVKVDKKGFSVFIKDTKRRNIAVKGRASIKTNQTNKEIASHHQFGARPFMKFTKRESNKIRKLIGDRFRNTVKKEFSK